jgi:DNA-binding beta-propeller fold protein YncE
VNEDFSGDPLVDPLAIVANPDGTKLYVVDSLAADGASALYSLSTPGFVDTLIASRFQVEFPAGIGVDPDDMWIYYSQVATTSGSSVSYAAGALARVATDGSAWEVVSDDPAALSLPAGVCAVGDATYLTDLSSLGTADIFVYR